MTDQMPERIEDFLITLRDFKVVSKIPGNAIPSPCKIVWFTSQEDAVRLVQRRDDDLVRQAKLEVLERAEERLILWATSGNELKSVFTSDMLRPWEVSEVLDAMRKELRDE